MLLNAEDGNQLDERIPMKNTFPTNCSEETKMKAIVRALLSDVDTDTDTDDNENENENASANEKIVSKECESRLGNISAGLRSLSPSPAVFDDRTISISDTSNLESHKDRKVKADSNFPGNGDELIAFNSRSKYISKNDDDNNNDKDREEDNDNNSNNSSHSSNSNKMNKKRNKYKGNDMVKNNVLKLKDIDGPAELIQNSLCSQIEILVGKLNFHMKKIQRHIKYFPKDLLESTSTILNTEYSGKNNIDLWKYWSEIAILIGRFDYLESHFEGKEDKILNSFKDFSIHRNVATVAKDEMKETNSKHHDKRDGGGNYNDNDRKMKEKEKDDNVDMKKRKQLSTRYTCISDKTESDSIITNKCNCGYDYNHDNRAIIYNTRGYPFGYNNHFISGNNYYGYPPPNTQQRDNTNFNMYSDQNQNQNQNQNLNLNQTNKNQQQSDKYNSNIQILKNSNYSKSKHNYNSQNNSQNNSNNNFDAQDEIDENLDQNSDALNSSGNDVPSLILFYSVLFYFTLFYFMIFTHLSRQI